MSLFKKIKCYLSCALLAWFVYHIKTTCPLCKPLPVDTEGVDALCLQSHKVYSYVKPYTEPLVHQAVEYYNESPIKPYVEEYYPVVEQQVLNVYGIVAEKVDQLVERLNDNELSNEKNIVIPDEYDAFTKKVGEPATTPNEDVDEPTPVPTNKVTNIIIATDADFEEPIVTGDATELPEETDAVNTKESSEEADSKLERLVHEAAEAIKLVAAEEIIEAVEAIGEQL